VLAVVLTCMVFVLVASLPERLDFVRQAQAALLYVANWQFILEARDYFASDAGHSPFMHFWSLSVEEQFYVFFPLLVLLVHRVAPRREKVMFAAFLTVAGVSLAAQVVSARHDPTRAYFATDARLYQRRSSCAASCDSAPSRRAGRDPAVCWREPAWWA
jgi:peptidoglycan/LPS O-acetylase OafA/YrhL